MPSTDSPINLAPSRIAALWPLAVSLVLVVASFVTLQGNVARAQERADEAFSKASAASDALHAIDVRLERIQTVLERIERQQK